MISEQELNCLGVSAIEMAEEKCGKRENKKFNGFKYWNNTTNPPQQYGDDHKGYTIYIGDLAKNSKCEALFQVSHESIHLLSPTLFENVSVLEEGVATFFSIYYIELLGYGTEAKKYLEHLKKEYPKYYGAYENILSINDLFETVTKIRAKFNQNKFSALTIEQLSEFTSARNLEILTLKFAEFRV